MSDHPSHITIPISIKPDISVEFNNINQQTILTQISLHHKVAIFYEMKDKAWKEFYRSPITEMENGLCHWCDDKTWNRFNNKVQKAYTDIIAEKEILG